MTTQTIEEAVEDFQAKQKLVEPNGFLADVGEDYEAVDFNMEVVELWLREALQAQRDAGAREERENIIEIVKFTKFRDTQTQEPYHKYLQQSKGVEYIRNKILKALTPPTK